MAQTSVHDYVNSLHRQIAETAARIKRQQYPGKTEISTTDTDRLPDRVRFVSYTEVQSYELINSENAYMLLGKAVATDNGYAAGAYRYAEGIDKKSSVIDGLIFDNNQNFDFRV